MSTANILLITELLVSANRLFLQIADSIALAQKQGVTDEELKVQILKNRTLMEQLRDED